MVRNNFILMLGILVIGLLNSTCKKNQKNFTSSTFSSQPNIVYILADDLGYADIGAYGQEKIKTPNLDQMAEEGMKFTQHYAGSTVCAPSRSVLLTGLHTGHTPIRGNRVHLPIGQRPIPYSTTTVAEVLKEAGYTTGAFGKWGLGYPGSEGSPSHQGFDYFFGYNGQRRAHFYFPEFLFREVQGKGIERVALGKNKVIDNPDRHPGAGPPQERGQYSQDAIVDEALTFIDQHNKNPFFLYLPLTIPHASLSVPQEHLKIYLNENGESIFPEEPYQGGHYSDQLRPRATYAAMVTLLDKYVGQLIEKLDEKGLGENTLVIFTSDNGPHAEGGNDPDFFDSNGPLREIKRDLYEGGIRVPMLAWWPGTIKEGSESDHISAFWDIMPTFAELANTQAPPVHDGISLVPTLTGKGKQKKHDYLYWEFDHQGGKQAVRMDKWKGIRKNVKNNPEASIELYNLEKDTGEQHNVADKYPQITTKIKQIMSEARVPSEDFSLMEE